MISIDTSPEPWVEWGQMEWPLTTHIWRERNMISLQPDQFLNVTNKTLPDPNHITAGAGGTSQGIVRK